MTNRRWTWANASLNCGSRRVPTSPEIARARRNYQSDPSCYVQCWDSGSYPYKLPVIVPFMRLLGRRGPEEAGNPQLAAWDLTVLLRIGRALEQGVRVPADPDGPVGVGC